MTALLDVRDLRTHFQTDDGTVKAVDGVDFTVDSRQTLGIVGESGSGKSVTCLTIMGLNESRNTESSGQALFNGEDLLTASQRRLRALRGSEIAMIFQDPMTSLNPVHSIGRQLVEAVLLHEDVTQEGGARRALSRRSRRSGSHARERRIDDYPHQFSGGMRQRVMIAMAMINDPKLLIADEPTTALDVTTQAQILSLMQKLQDDHGTAIILITHDLGVVAEIGATRWSSCTRPRSSSAAPSTRSSTQPQHPYTWGLLGSLPRLDADVDRLDPDPRPAAVAAQPAAAAAASTRAART